MGTPTLPEELTDGRIRLRPPTRDDVDRITEICQDPAIQHWTTLPSPYGRQSAEQFVAMAERGRADATSLHLLVEVDEQVVGAVGIGWDDHDRRGIVGYWIAPEARGSGVAVAATRLLCAWGLDEGGLARIELDAAAGNVASNRVAARLGFRLEGTRRSAMLLSGVGPFEERRDDANDWGLLPGELL